MDAAEMRRTLDDALIHGRTAFADATTVEELESAQTQILGRKSPFSMVQKTLGDLPHDERRELGMRANEVRAALAEALEDRREALATAAEGRLLEEDRLDLTLPGRRSRPGSLHPLTLVEREVIGVFTRMGYRVAEGPEIEDDWHNFQALNIPTDHPARTMKDSLYVSIPGHPELLLRTETSAVQIRTMQSQPPPVYVIAPGRVYRR
jgi:phenylalanyl-tRNA synthetase alpha chain